MKKIVKKGLIIVATILLVAFAVFFVWSQFTYKASEIMSSYVDLNDIQQENDWLVFTPTEQTKTGVIIYPGAKVEPEAYSYYAQQLAESGYTIIIPNMNFNFAIFDINEAESIMKQFTDIEQWVIGGHSLGGVAAASFAYDHLSSISGLILLASYPSDANDFSHTDLPILSLYAQYDQLTTVETINETKQLLSSEATLSEVTGGNHAQFGMYGKQDGDGEATISVKEQQQFIAKETIHWLEECID